MPRIIFFGSSDFSLPGLQACIDSKDHEIVAVITTPPQKQGRGLTLTPTVVAQFCEKKNIICYAYQKLDDKAFSDVESLKPEVFVCSSYGKFIPSRFLALPQQRFNIHPSLLPKHRGASPLNAPFLEGESTTGLSIADITKELDAGDIYYQEECDISTEDDSEKMSIKLSEKSYSVMMDLLEKAKTEKIEGAKQDSSKSSYAGKLKKEDGRLKFSDPAEKWDRVIRGLKPWPGAFAEICLERVAILEARSVEGQPSAKTGEVVAITKNSLVIQTPQGAIELLSVKPAGKKAMSAGDYARGKRWQAGLELSN